MLGLAPFFSCALACCFSLLDDHPPNPDLRPHFRLAFRSTESFKVLNNLPHDSPIRTAVWDYPLAQVIAKCSEFLPKDADLSRTYLRCRPLGWVSGGHTIDVVEMNAIDYEGILVGDGESLKAVSNTELLLGDKRNQMLLADKANNRVLSLFVPGGFEGTATEVIAALRSAGEDFESNSPEHDWSLSFIPLELLDKHLWETIPLGINVGLQPKDGDDEDVRALRKQLCTGLKNAVKFLSEDVENVRLVADFHNDGSAKVQLIIHVDEERALSTVLESLDGKHLIPKWPVQAECPAFFGFCAAPSSVFQAAGIDVLRQHGSFGRSEIEQPSPRPTHFAFGLSSSHSGQVTPELFLGACHSTNGGLLLHESVTQVAVTAKLNGGVQPRFLEKSTEPLSSSAGFLTSLTRDNSPQTAELHMEDVTFFRAQCRLRETIKLLYPEVAQTISPALGDPVIWLQGEAENNEFRIVADFPPDTDEYVYLLFEQVFHHLKRLGETIPF